ncbi:hypothetical protein [Nostoc sp.]
MVTIWLALKIAMVADAVFNAVTVRECLLSRLSLNPQMSFTQRQLNDN